MSAGSSLPYRLRPNKAVDRELFLSLLMRRAPNLALEKYHYVGLGGPFLEDFRLVHGRLGIARMTCIETEEQDHKRQVFNRPIASIERFARTIGTVPLGRVLRVTLNANPTSLGKPDPKDLSVEVEGEVSEDRAVKPTIQEWRLARFKERLGALIPSGITAAGGRQRGAELPGSPHRVGARLALRRWAGDGHRRIGCRSEGRHDYRGVGKGQGVLHHDRCAAPPRPTSALDPREADAGVERRRQAAARVRTSDLRDGGRSVRSLQEVLPDLPTLLAGGTLANEERRMTPTTADTRAWLAKEATPVGPFVVRLDGDLVASAIGPGHWVVVVDTSGALKSAGRILRIRADLESTTLYFDKLHTVAKAGTLTVIGLTPPTGPVTRLRPEDRMGVLARDGVSSSDDVPLIQDAAYLRELLQLATRDDLLGPANGHREMVVAMRVRDRYLVGKLAPRTAADAAIGALVEPAAAADEEDDSAQESDAPIHEPGAEFNRASGLVEPEDDALDEIDTTNNQSLVPSSMGLTFCVGPDVKTLDIPARWGSYARVPKEEHNYTRPRKNRETGEVEETKVKVWRRSPRGGRVTLTLKDGSITSLVPDAGL